MIQSQIVPGNGTGIFNNFIEINRLAHAAGLPGIFEQICNNLAASLGLPFDDQKALIGI